MLLTPKTLSVAKFKKYGMSLADITPDVFRFEVIDKNSYVLWNQLNDTSISTNSSAMELWAWIGPLIEMFVLLEDLTPIHGMESWIETLFFELESEMIERRDENV